MVDDDGRIVGQLQPLTSGQGYTVSALCFCTMHKERCARMRTWKMDKEPPEMVERVLVHWLLSASCFNSTAEHKAARRY